MHAKLAEAQHAFDGHGRVYEAALGARGWEGDMLRSMRKAVGVYSKKVDYLPAMERCFETMHQHRKLHDVQFHLEQEYAALKGAHEVEMVEAEGKLFEANEIARGRSEQLTDASLRPPRRGRPPASPRSDDGLSVGLISRTVSLQMDDVNSLATGGHDEEEGVSQAAGHG